MQELDRVRQQLETKLRQLLERADDLESVLSDPGDADAEENATEMENDEALLAVGNVTSQEIRDIKLALTRLDGGHYGVCTGCGKKIASERLASIPWATTCVRCA